MKIALFGAGGMIAAASPARRWRAAPGHCGNRAPGKLARDAGVAEVRAMRADAQSIAQRCKARRR